MKEKLHRLLARHPAVADWEVRELATTSDQLYLSGTDVDCRRTVRSRQLLGTVYSLVETDAGMRQGTASFGTFEDDPQLAGQLEAAIATAGAALNPPFELVGPGLAYPAGRAADPACRDGAVVLAELADRFRSAAAGHPGVSLASLELFLDNTEAHLSTSRGLDLRQDATRIYAELILFFADASGETEFHTELRAPDLRHFDVEKMVARYAQYVRDRHHGRPPATGTFPVVMAGETLSELWRYVGFHSSAASRYNGRALFEPGRPIFEAAGDRLTIRSDPGLDGGIGSLNFDPQGLPLRPFELVRDGTLVRYWSGKRHADYLGLEATGPLTNLVVAPGAAAWDELVRSDGPVYVIESISSWEPNPVTGVYSGEIRLGYRIEGGRSVPIRGGSVNGNVVEGFGRCRLAAETILDGDYHGPRGVRFESATLAGEDV